MSFVVAYFSSPHHSSRAICVFVCIRFWCIYQFPTSVPSFFERGSTSSIIGHALIHPIFIHRILLFLGLDGFPSGEPVHVVAPIGATFLRQKAAHLRVAPSRPRGASSSAVPPPPSSTGADVAETSGAAADADADVPLLTTSDDLDIQRMLDHVLTV